MAQSIALHQRGIAARRAEGDAAVTQHASAGRRRHHAMPEPPPIPSGPAFSRQALAGQACISSNTLAQIEKIQQTSASKLVRGERMRRFPSTPQRRWSEARRNCSRRRAKNTSPWPHRLRRRGRGYSDREYRGPAREGGAVTGVADALTDERDPLKKKLKRGGGILTPLAANAGAFYWVTSDWPGRRPTKSAIGQELSSKGVCKRLHQAVC